MLQFKLLSDLNRSIISFECINSYEHNKFSFSINMIVIKFFFNTPHTPVATRTVHTFCLFITLALPYLAFISFSLHTFYFFCLLHFFFFFFNSKKVKSHLLSLPLSPYLHNDRIPLTIKKIVFFTVFYRMK